MYNAEKALDVYNELKDSQSSGIIRHNMAIFSGGRLEELVDTAEGIPQGIINTVGIMWSTKDKVVESITISLLIDVDYWVREKRNDGGGLEMCVGVGAKITHRIHHQR